MLHIKQFEHLKIHLDHIKSATNNFSDHYCIGRGGFGSVYKGELVHFKGKTIVALKRLDRAFGQGAPEFWKEIIMLSLYRHENIVSLLGFCDEGEEKILVYEYASKRSLDLYLNSDDLNWVRRLNICIGAARGLAYLHNSGGNQQRVLHRDIKSSNILLDENWNARISDFGLSKFAPNQPYSFLVSNVVGTIGYCDPVYIQTGLLTKESDVYSFGVVLFEVLCGRLCIGNSYKPQPLIELVRHCFEQQITDTMVFRNIRDEISRDSLKAFTLIAYQCLDKDREARPQMVQILKELEIALEYQLSHAKEAKMDNYKENNDNDTILHFLKTDRGMFHLDDLLSAKGEVLGSGSLGTSYKAIFSGRLDIVVKMFRPINDVGLEDLHIHMRLMGNLSHPNLLTHVAFTKEENMLLITDFAVNGSLASHLHVKSKTHGHHLDWPTRLKIIQGVARGLDYLHQQFPNLSLPHGHLKSSNVLLDGTFNPLLADYALVAIINKKDAKQYMVAYKSPDFTIQERLTKKTDIWCLGILILELMTGKSPKNYLEQGKGGELDLKTWVNSIAREEWADMVFDKDMKWTKNSEIEMIDLLDIGIRCCESDIRRRWGVRKAFEKIEGLKETWEDEEDM